MERENSHNNVHVVLLPFLAFGHMIPFQQLAIALAKSGIRVSYVSTPRNIERLSKPPRNLSHLINFVSLPFPILESHPLPDGAEATVDIPANEFEFFMKAFDLLKQPFQHFVSEQKPNWLVMDFMAHWGADVAQNCGVPVMAFLVFSAATSVFCGPHEFLARNGEKRSRFTPESLTSPPPWVPFPSEVACRPFEAAVMYFALYESNDSGITLIERFAKMVKGGPAIAIRTFHELEGEYLRLLAELIGKPVIPVGFLPRGADLDRREITDKSLGEMFDWLDKQDPKSVVYVAFGSEYKLTKEQIYEIAYGLEESHLPFLWALRKPHWAIDDSDALPPGFSQTSHKHKVCIGWAPQMEILSHPSIGGSLFHAGWGSVIETLQFGHALVILPLMFDQPLNARLAVEKGLAIEVDRGEDGSFKRADIALSLRRSMVSEEGEEMRARSRAAAVFAGDRKLHDHYFEEFVEFLKNGIGKLNL